MNIKILLPTLALFFGFNALAQTDGVLIDYSGTTRDNSAVLDVRSTTQGILLPRVTTAQRTAISSPADGLLVYDSDLNEYYRYDSASGSWKVILSGNTGFVQNQYSSQQSSSEFWISGRGRIDGTLTVGGGTIIDNGNTNTGTVANGFLAFGNASGEGIGSKRNAGGNQFGLDFYTQSTNRMAITNGGNIGVGTTSPGARLTIGDVSTPGYKNFMVGDDSYFTDVDVVDFIGLYGNTNSDQGGLRLGSDGSYIYGDGGNIGIGTTTPSAKLQINGSTVVQNALVVDNANGNTGTAASSLTFGNASGEGLGSRRNSGSNQYGLDFYTQSANRMVITNQGNVGVGTTAPDAPFNVIHPTTNTTPTAPTGYWAALIENHYDANDGRHGLSVATRWGSPTSKVFEAASYWNGSSQAYTPILTVTGNRRVGIGNTSPSAKLHVTGVGDAQSVSYGYLNPGGSTGTSGPNNIDYSIQADGRIRAPEFNAISDQRIKTVVEHTNPKELLTLVNKLEVTKYQYIDKVEHGEQAKQGFIAQQVESVVPTAVKISQDYVPNVFALAKTFDYNGTSGICTVTTDKPHDFTIDSEIKIFVDQGMTLANVERVINANQFSIKLESKPDQVFVYGKKVDDFRAVDYDQLFSIGIGAIQELSKENQQLKSEVESLKDQLKNMGDLKAEIESIKGHLNLDVYGSTTE